VLGDDVAEPLGRIAERQNDRRSVGRVDPVRDASDPNGGGRVGVEIELGEVGELPALVLRAGQRQLTRQRGALAAPLNEPVRLPGRDRGVSQ
jgi:hypothetical protein